MPAVYTVYICVYVYICVGGSLQGGQLRITYKDLLEAQSKGKWWVVGSAWQGSQADSHSLTGSAVTKVSRTSSHSSERPEGDKFSKSLLELARKQRMNTENRRLIFCTIMSAEVSNDSDLPHFIT